MVAGTARAIAGLSVLPEQNVHVAGLGHLRKRAVDRRESDAGARGTQIGVQLLRG